MGLLVREDQLVEEYDGVVARALLQPGPEHEALHLAHHHQLHARMLRQQLAQQEARLHAGREPAGDATCRGTRSDYNDTRGRVLGPANAAGIYGGLCLKPSAITSHPLEPLLHPSVRPSAQGLGQLL